MPLSFSAHRRGLLLAAVSTAGLAACAPAATRPAAAAGPQTPVLGTGPVTIDMHTHAGRVTLTHDPAAGVLRPFLPVAEPMRAGGLDVVCLAIVADASATRVSADRRRFEPFRQPAPGELYQLSQTAFARLEALVEHEKLLVVTDAAGLRAARTAGPSVIIASEGADFLEGVADRVDEAWRVHRLRHLQLTHYRPNELGDIQTEAPVHGGLTDFGAEVVRRCNRLGLVVDVAHGTFDLVKRAAAVSAKPLVLSHTSLVRGRLNPRTRQISPDHARAVAGTGGVIGVWPSAGYFDSLQAMADGVRRLADIVGIDHVGLGSDMLGFLSPPVLRSYRQLPDYAQALAGAGLSPQEVGQVLGGNYLRVFEASMA
ncbi:MAG: membrane dipeptidase [Pseudomonadota bacterium]